MNDLISRQAAIDAICKEWCYVTYGNCPHVDDGFVCDGCDDVKALNALPSADRPRGEWISKEELIDAIKDAEFVYDGDEDGHKEHDISEMVRVIFKDIIDNLSTTTKGEA